MTTQEILDRKALMDSLEDHEKAFCKPLLGYQFNSSTQVTAPDCSDKESEENEDEIDLAGLFWRFLENESTCICSRYSKAINEKKYYLFMNKFVLTC